MRTDAHCVSTSLNLVFDTVSPSSQVLNVSPEHPAVMLSLRQVQCQSLFVTDGGSVLPEPVLEQLSNAVMMNPTNLGAWHVSGYLLIH